MISSRESVSDISTKSEVTNSKSRIIGPTGAGKSTVCLYRHFNVPC